MAPPAGHIRPARYLMIFLAIMVALYALVFGTGDHKPTPKLGIDLSGGTRVTLRARTENGKPPTSDALNQARQIIETRVNGLGVSGTEVLLDGDNIVITVPGEQGQQAKDLGQTAKLTFRKVVSAVAAGQQPAPRSQPGGQPGSTRPGSGQSGSGGKSSPQGRPAPHPGGTAPAAAPSQPSDPSNGDVDPEVAKQIRQAKRTRQSTDPKVQQQALASLRCGKSIRDPLAGNDDPHRPLVTCGQDGKLKYILGPVSQANDPNCQHNPDYIVYTCLTGSDIANATSGQNSQGPGFEVNLKFKNAGGDRWAEFTAKNVNKQNAFVLDSQVVSAPSINGPIPGGRTQITGNFSQAEAKKLANVLKYGSLPLSFESSDAQTVSATLGLASLQAGLLAGGIGLALVVVYCLFYYRLLGVLIFGSLALSGALVYAVLVLLGRSIGFSLDIAGVAGFIIAIGITADSFVILFERLKDEMREGRTFRSAVPRAWVRARRTILSGDMVSFLAAVVLYIVAVGDVQGFAFTLGMSTVLDLVVVFLVTHPLLVYASQSKLLSNPALSGLGSVQRTRAARRPGSTGGAAAHGASR
ncbi:MAG: protein translocase subunit SecD [Sciscionella sp.]